MKVLTTGGAGFIGSNLAGNLMGAGHNVIVLDNLLSGFRSNLNGLDSLNFIEGDVRDPKIVERANQDAGVVFHLAPSVGNKRSIDNPQEDAQINVIGTLQVLQAARAAFGFEPVISLAEGLKEYMDWAKVEVKRS